MKGKSVGRLSVVMDLLAFFWSNKLWWMIPLVLMLILAGLAIIFGQATGIGPFIYALI